MILKKSLKSGQAPLEIIRQRRMPCQRQGSLTGQATVEYFVLLAAIAGLTLISAQFFWPTIRDSVQKGYFPQAAERVVNADQGSGG